MFASREKRNARVESNKREDERRLIVGDTNNSEWNPQSFEERLNESPDHKWKSQAANNKNNKATRIQDLSLARSSAHTTSSEDEEDRQQSAWPYESSPCRMFGGRNTRKGNEEMNRQLFDPDFADNATSVSLSDVSDGDSFCCDDNSDSTASKTKATASVRKKKTTSSSTASLSSSSTAGRTKESSKSVKQQRGVSRKKSSDALSRATYHGGDDAPVRRVSRRHSSHGASEHSSKNKSSKSESQQLSVSVHGTYSHKLPTNKEQQPQEQHTIAFARRAGDRPRRRRSLEAKGSETTTSSSKTTNEPQRGVSRRSSHSSTAKPRRTSTTTSSSSKTTQHRMDLSAATTHDARPSRRRESTGRSGGVSRTKSSGDGLDHHPKPSRRGDELGTATLHGKSSVSRIRQSTRKEGRHSDDDSRNATSSSQQQSSRASSNKGDRRSMLNRAMSTANVRPPEEYAAATMGEPAPQQRRAGRRPQRDLLTLLREDKEVTNKDMRNADNRAVLHFLMLESKMEVSLEQLSNTVQKDVHENNGKTPRPAKPELYVEAAT